MKKKYLIKIIWLLLIVAVISCKKSGPVMPDPNPTPTPDPGGGNPPVATALLSSDPNFKAPTGFSSAHVALQPDGKIIIDAFSTVNSVSVIKVYRLNVNGSFDNTFDIDKDKTWFIKGIYGLHVLADGKILLCGVFTINGQTVYLVRLNSTGALDKTYVQPLLGGISKFQRTANGKVLAITVERTTSNVTTYDRPRMYRLNTDGSLDAGFNVPSYSFSGTNGSFSSVVPLVNGQILVSGVFSIGTDKEKRKNIARLNADGSVDMSFNFKYTLPAGTYPAQITTQSDGKIILAGNFTMITDPDIRDANYPYHGIARINVNGDIDLTFAPQPRFNYSNFATDITTLSDNRILLNWIGISANSFFNKNYIEFFGANGGVDNNYQFQYQYSSILLVFREAADQFLLVGGITVDNVTYPVIRLKKN